MNDDFNIYDLSKVRLIAESIIGNLEDPKYFEKICRDVMNVFEASNCAIFWFRNRDPKGWWLESFASKNSRRSPKSDSIPQENAGLFEWVKVNEKCLYKENIQPEAMIEFWGLEASEKMTVLLLPLNIDNLKFGIMTLIDPVIRLPQGRISKHIRIISNLILSASRNHLLFRNLLQDKEEFYDLYENSSDMVAVVYPDGILRDSNLAFRRILGQGVNPKGMKLSDIIRKGEDSNFYDCWAKLLDGEEVMNVDVLLACDEIKIIEAELSGNVCLHTDGRIAYVRLYLRDVTEKRKNERQKRELDLNMKIMRERELAQIGLMVSGVAHNIRNPVHTILGYLELMELKVSASKEIDVIKKHIGNITEIIDNLLDKVYHDRNTASQSINLNELLQRELKFLNANLYYKNDIRKDFQFDEDLPNVKGVYGDFSQAIMNVVYNALDAMQDCKERNLSIKTGFNEANGEIRISISDSGPGIPDNIRENIFEPFFTTKKRVKEGDHALASGSGLGLSSAKSLIEPYNGSIELESTIGKGTTFHLIFEAE